MGLVHLFVVLVVGAVCATGDAQSSSLPAPRVEEPTNERFAVTVYSSPPTTFEERRLWKEQRRGRLLLAAGVGALVSTGIFFAWAVPNRVCGYDHKIKAPFYGTAVPLTVGLSFTIAGATKLFRSWRVHRYHVSSKQILAASAISLGAAAATQALLGLLFALETPACST